MSDQQVRAYFDRLADTIEVGPAPLDAVLEGRTGHRARIMAGLAVAGLVAAAVLTVALSNRNDDPPRPVDPATVTDSVDPVESQSGAGAWWTPGSIHFGTGTLPFDDIDDPTDDVGWMAPAPDGVIVAQVDGTIAAVETSGRVTEIGRFRTVDRDFQGPNFFVDRADGLIAWTNGDRLFVYDPESRTIVAERADSARYAHNVLLLGFDDGKIYWDDRRGDRIWDWADDTTRHVGGSGSYIHSVQAGRWVIQLPSRYGLLDADAPEETPVPLPIPSMYPMPGLSPDGALVAFSYSRTFDRVVVLRSDDPRAPATELDLPQGYVAAVTWRDDRTLVVIMRERDSLARILLDCSATTGACTTEQRLEGPVVIAGDKVTLLELPQ
jgi:hypothetical protein